MSGEPGPPSRVRRMLPSVSEVLKELTSRAAVEPDVAFRAAREVCAEELKRIRDAGGDSVPLEELVQRAYRRVTGQELPGAEPPAAATEVVPVFEAAEEDPFAVPPPPAAPAGDEPFLETSGALDLKWDEGREPFAGAPGAPAAAPLFDEPAEPAAGEPAPTESVPVPFALPADEPPYPAAPAAEAFPPAGDASGPGDETLSRLSREAEAIQLQDVFPRPGAGEAAGEASAYPEFREAAGPGPAEPPPFEDDEDTVLTVPRGGRKGEGRPRVGLVLGVAAGLAALAGLGYLLVGLWMERDAAPAPVAVARPRAEKPTPAAAPAAEAPAASTNVESPAPTPPTPPATGPTAAPTPAPAAPPAAVAPAAAPTVVPSRPAAKVPPPPAPAPVVAATPPPAAAPVARSRDGLVVTRDRAGQPQVFSIHFTSYKDRPSAERDLKRVEAMAGMKGYVAEVDLGEKGVWQRVMVGAFASAEEAKAVRAELAAKGTRDMGWVYRVVGPDGAADR